MYRCGYGRSYRSYGRYPVGASAVTLVHVAHVVALVVVLVQYKILISLSTLVRVTNIDRAVETFGTVTVRKHHFSHIDASTVLSTIRTNAG